jgi:hypothetical protein
MNRTVLKSTIQIQTIDNEVATLLRAPTSA